MKSYNGFSSERRFAALAWFKSQPAREFSSCQECGKTSTLQPHSEDYSLPFGPHIGEHVLCAACHSNLHRRFRFPSSFHAYREKILSGHQRLQGKWVYSENSPRGKLLREELEMELPPIHDRIRGENE